MAELLPLARAGLWCGPVLVFLAASHRMLPFLGDGLWPALDRRWPNWPLWLLASLVPAQAADALLLHFTHDVLQNEAALTNVQNAISYVQTADGFMSGMTKILSRMSELAILATDVTKNASDIDLYQQE